MRGEGSGTSSGNDIFDVCMENALEHELAINLRKEQHNGRAFKREKERIMDGGAGSKIKLLTRETPAAIPKINRVQFPHVLCRTRRIELPGNRG